MNTFVHRLASPLLGVFLLAGASLAQAQDTIPEVLHYRFDGTGTTVPNLASAPPAGTTEATIMGAVTQGPPDLNTGAGGGSLIGTGNASSTDYLNTGWAPNLGTGSWTISVATSNIIPSSTLFNIFGDVGTGSFRCFTNGVAGPNNWILRGAGLTDVPVPGAAITATTRTTFVYDSVASEVRAYLNGTLVSTVAQTPGAVTLTGTGPLKVMGYSTNVGAPAGGLIDDFRVYDRALSPAEVAGLDARPVIEVSGNALVIADGDLTPDPADFTDFGSIILGAGNVVRTFSIVNNGNIDLTQADISFAGPGAADFSVNVTPTLPLAGSGGATTFDVSFAPSATGLRDATLSITTNDIRNTVYEFAVQGVGQAADLQVSKSNFLEGLVPGTDAIYTIQVLNAGPDSVTSASIVDDVDDLALSGAEWTCVSQPDGLCPNAAGSGDINETTGVLASGDLLEYTLVATVVGPAPGTVSNTATATNLDGSDPDVSNNSATDTDTLLPLGIFGDGFEEPGLKLLRPSIGR